MTMGHHHHTATILPFPGRARAADKSAFAGKPALASGTETKALRAAQASFTDSWYHQAAIDETPHARKP